MGGLAWAKKTQPLRRRATYRRLKGTEQFLGFYDVHADCLSGIFRRQKRLTDLFDAFRRLRACYPRKRLLVIMDNLHNIHDHPPVDTPSPATTWTAKTGHHGGGDRGSQGLPRGLLEMQVGAGLGAPALRPALEDVSVVQ